MAAEKTEVLQEENFTGEVIIRLKEFESSLLKAMTKDGWDGDEDLDKVQWTFTGALFYSIIVITTIGNFIYLEMQSLKKSGSWSDARTVWHPKTTLLLVIRPIRT